MGNAQSDAGIDDPAMWAISYQQLMQFHADAAQEFKDEDYESKTMRDVVDRMIAPWCRRTHRSYALTLNPQGLKIDAFITHAWDEPFASFVRSIIRVFETTPVKPNLWICSFALMQGNDQVTEEALNVPLIEAPFVKALRKASSYIVVRNATTDVYTRIWCVCELMFAKKEGLVPRKTHVTGPCCVSNSNAPITCLDAKATDIRDRDKIVEALLQYRSREEVDIFINLFRLYNTPSVTEQETTRGERDSSVQLFQDTAAPATVGNDVSENMQDAVSRLSEREELGIVGIQLSGARMDSCRGWEDYVSSTESNFNDLLKSLLKYGELKEGKPKVRKRKHRRHKRGRVKHIRSHGKERAAVKLHCAVKVYEDLDECDYRRVREICRNLAALLKTGGASPSQLERLMIGAAWRGSLVLFLEAPTPAFDILFKMLKDCTHRVPLGVHDASICGLEPAFLLPPLEEFLHHPFDQGRRTSDAIVWEIESLLLVMPRSSQALNRIVRQGQRMWPEMEEGDLQILPQVRVFKNSDMSTARKLESKTRELEPNVSPNITSKILESSTSAVMVPGLMEELSFLSAPTNVTSKIRKLESSMSAAEVERIVEELKILARDNEQNDRVEIATAGGIECIVAAMNRHADHAGVQEAGCGALGNLTVNDDNDIRIAAAGGIECIVSTMNRHADHAGVQEAGCGALWNLAFNKDNEVEIASAGGIECIVSAMNRHTDHVGVQQAGCRALWNLAFNGDNKIKIASAGGIESILSAMNRHADHAPVQRFGCASLWDLAVNDDNRVKIAAAGGIESIVSAMNRHPDREGVQMYGRGALRILARNKDIKAMINAMGGIP